MRKYRYTIGVDEPNEPMAIGEACLRIRLGEELFDRYEDYEGEMPIHTTLHEVEAIESEAGPNYAVQLTFSAHRALPHSSVAGFEMVERVGGETDG